MNLNSMMFSIDKAPLIDGKDEKISEIRRWHFCDAENTNITNISRCLAALVFTSLLSSELGFGSFDQVTAAAVDCVESLTPSLLKRGKNHHQLTHKS